MYLAAERSERSERSLGPVIEIALSEFEHVFSFIFARVGNRADAEELTQQVALKALPRLRNEYPGAAVRGYLYTTARSVMASFWSRRALVPEAELADEVWIDGRGDELTAPADTAAWVERILNALPANYRRVLELRFLRGYSLHETAVEMGKTVGGIKVMQLRALRAAARVDAGETNVSRSARHSHQSRRGHAAGPGSAYVLEPWVPGGSAPRRPSPRPLLLQPQVNRTEPLSRRS